MAAPEILEVDLLAFEQGSAARQAAVVDGVMRSLGTGFVLTTHDLPADLLDEAYGLLGAFFALEQERKQAFRVPEACGQTGYTGTLVETAAGESRADWKEMLNWAAPLPAAHPLRRRFPLLYPEQLLPEAAVPGITAVLETFHHAIAELQRRFLRVIATGLGAHPAFFDAVVSDAPTLTRAIHYPPMAASPPGGHVWAAAHADINLITALPRATAPGLQVQVDGRWVEALAPDGQVIVNSGLMLEQLSNGRIPSGWHRVVAPEGCSTSRLSVVQFCHPRPSTLLSPLVSCISPERPQRYAGVLAADALEDVLYRINLMG
jgi:isopenicillin N synthase-like dioxygenase